MSGHHDTFVGMTSARNDRKYVLANDAIDVDLQVGAEVNTVEFKCFEITISS